MPGTVTDFDSAFTRFPRSLVTVIPSARKQEQPREERREPSWFKSLSRATSLTKTNSLGSLADVIWLVIRPDLVILHGFPAGKRNVFVMWTCSAHAILFEHCAGAVSAIWFRARFFFQETYIWCMLWRNKSRRTIVRAVKSFAVFYCNKTPSA